MPLPDWPNVSTDTSSKASSGKGGKDKLGEQQMIYLWGMQNDLAGFIEKSHEVLLRHLMHIAVHPACQDTLPCCYSGLLVTQSLGVHVVVVLCMQTAWCASAGAA